MDGLYDDEYDYGGRGNDDVENIFDRVADGTNLEEEITAYCILCDDELVAGEDEMCVVCQNKE